MFEVLPLGQEEAMSPAGSETFPNGSLHSNSDASKYNAPAGPPFAEADSLEPLFDDATKELVDLYIEVCNLHQTCDIFCKLEPCI